MQYKYSIHLILSFTRWSTRYLFYYFGKQIVLTLSSKFIFDGWNYGGNVNLYNNLILDD